MIIAQNGYILCSVVLTKSVNLMEIGDCVQIDAKLGPVSFLNKA